MLSQAGPLPRPLGDPARFFTYQKMCRTTAWVVRFIRRIQGRACPETSRCLVEINIPLQEGGNRTIQIPRLTANKLSEAESWWIRLTQQEAYPMEYDALSSGKPLPRNSKLIALCLQWDPAGRHIRVPGRIRLIFEEEGKLPPLLLPPSAKSRPTAVVELIIWEVHRKVLHSGLHATLAELQQRFWCVRARQLAKRLLKELRCVPATTVAALRRDSSTNSQGTTTASSSL